MTTVQERTPTATGPTVTSTARRARGPLLVAVALVLAAVLGAVLGDGRGGRLDPDSYTPGGSRALAELLRARGVTVERVDAVDAVVAQARTDATVVVPFPQALARSELEQLADLPVRLVLVGAQQDALDALDVDIDAGSEADVEQRQPACELPAARVAGDADLGGTGYLAGAVQAVGCYSASGRATLLVVPSERLVLLGDGQPLTNDGLDERGNAALALGLLGETNRVLWLVPRPGRMVPAGEQRPLSELLPDAIRFGAYWLAVVVAVLALWRARRLGRVVEEPLPVVVPAAETVEGRSRLYRAADARGAAADALRAGTRDRLARRTALPPDAGRREVVEVVAQRTGSDAATVDGLLYGDAPTDDAALVRLAQDLRTLEQTLTQEVAGP